MAYLRGLGSLLGRLPPGAAVVAACWAVQQLPELPSSHLAPALLCLAGLLIAAGLRCAVAPAAGAGVRSPPGAAPLLTSGCLLVGVVAGSAGWALMKADSHLSQRIGPDLEGRDLVVAGIVEEMPQSAEFGVRFRFRIEDCMGAVDDCPRQRLVRLSWGRGSTRAGAPEVGADSVRAGQRWQLTVRLKRPHASFNPGLFDAELRALQEAIAAIGSVRQAASLAAPRLLDDFVASPVTVIERMRESLRARIDEALASADLAARGVVVALVVGDQAAIPARWWEVFNRTGIAHLVSISGLHITMLAGIAGALAGRAWRSRAVMRLCGGRSLAARIPVPHARWLVGVLVAFVYAALAGWGIPAQRTCWMLAVAGAAKVSGRSDSVSGVLFTAAAVVCLFDPWAPMAAGFWLSFGAVAAIVWSGSCGRRPSRPEPRDDQPAGRAAPSEDRGVRADADVGKAPLVSTDAETDAVAPVRPRPDKRMRAAIHAALSEAVRSQVAATLVLLPLGVLFFSSISLVGPLANAIAIPIVSGVITPLALAGAFAAMAWPHAGSLLLAPAAWLTEWLMRLVVRLDFDGAGAIAVAAPSAPALMLAVAACVVLLAPARLPGRALALFALLPLVVPSAEPLGEGQLRLTALDVGQGTAILIETSAGRLMYDAGPSFGTEHDAASRVILPYLRSHGVRSLDALVISHLDIDHSGGALTLLGRVDVGWLASSLPEHHEIVTAAPRHVPCRRGERWRWGSADFVWLHPGDGDEAPRRSKTNARSCVLLVRAPGGSVLLAGDIEAAQEKRLLEVFDPADLRADLLIAPHHGSATSSTRDFLAAVAPRWALFQVGYRNRFGHPDARVLHRYRDASIRVLRSDAHGAIRVTMTPGRDPVIELGRDVVPRYWRIRPPDPP